MYGFEPTEEQQMLVEAVRRFAVNELRPAAHAADEAGELSQDLIEKGWALGVLQASVPEEYGGFGERSAVTGALAAEELAYGDLATALAVMAPAAYALPVLEGGSPEQRAELIPPVVGGQWKPYAAAFVEPEFDFTPSQMQTNATARNGDFELTGRKVWVPFADSAEGLLVYAQLDGAPAAFAVPTDAQGLSIGQRDQLLGLYALPTYAVELSGVRVPATARLSELDFANVLSGYQVGIAAMAIGVSRAAYEYALAYAKDRVAFGSPIAQKQAIAFMLAEMATEIDGARLMVWEAAWELDQGHDAANQAYLALIGAADTAMLVTDRAVQILGGHGYIREHPVERWMREARGIPTFTGLAMV